MPNKWTFLIPSAKKLITRIAGDGSNWADPFAGKSDFAEFRNDLNPENNQPHCLEASEFLKTFADGSLNGVIFDPPYSKTQAARAYSGFGVKYPEKENQTGGFPLVRDEIVRAVKHGGRVISFGWNTVGMGKKRGGKIIEILIISHGGNRNDTLCTVEEIT
jgi:hypothetical protein